MSESSGATREKLAAAMADYPHENFPASGMPSLEVRLCLADAVLAALAPENDVLREIRDAITPDDGPATDALNRVDTILDREGVLGPRRELLAPEPAENCQICGNPQNTGRNKFGTHQCPPVDHDDGTI
jgi:hypothetical protein